MKRIIFHVDVNNAYLSWTAVHLLEQGEKLDIRTIPSIIAGDEEKRHGIVLAKSPIAKRLGINSAETLYEARKKCHNLKIYPPEFEWYSIESNKMYEYLKEYTPVIERYSIDECFLDLTGTNLLYDDYLKLAYKIKDDIKNKFGFTVNVGIGNNKLCAKMASDFEKPDKVHTLYENEIKHKMWNLPIEDLFMVGKSTSKELRSMNINTIGDLASCHIDNLKKHFKNNAEFLKNSALGIDNSKVGERKTKTESISISETLPFDTDDYEKLKEILFRQTEELCRSLREQRKYCTVIAVTYKNSNFYSYQHQEKLEKPINKTMDIYNKVIDCFNDSYKNDKIRNIGIRLGDLTRSRVAQMNLFEEIEDEKEDNTFDELVDNLNKKFGNVTIVPASIKIIGKSTKHKHIEKR